MTEQMTSLVTKILAAEKDFSDGMKSLDPTWSDPLYDACEAARKYVVQEMKGTEMIDKICEDSLPDCAFEPRPRPEALARLTASADAMQAIDDFPGLPEETKRLLKDAVSKAVLR